MKNNLVILSLVAVLVLTASFAYAGNYVGMRIIVPFDFFAGDQQLPAGEYTFAMESGLDATGSKVTVYAKDGTAVCFLLTRSGTGETANRLLFNQYGNKRFISSISIKGFTAAVKTTKLEKELGAEIQNRESVVLVSQK